MKYRRIIAALLVAFTLFVGATAFAAGTAADPLMTKSHLETVFNTPLEDYRDTVFRTLEASLEAKAQGMQATAEEYARKVVAAAYAEELAQAVLEKVNELQQADQTTLTAGSTRQPGPAIKEGILYMMLADDGSGIEVTSNTAQVLLKDGARGGYELQYEGYADALNLLGLFRGTNAGYELERSPSRIEAIIMLIRLLGEDSPALQNDTVSPFLDLSDWEDGKRYVAYAYRMRYTNGTGPTTFGPNQNSALEQYLTFVLRALGYRDGVDFQWDSTCRDLAVAIGLLDAEELTAIARDGFRRDHVVAISWRALDCRLQDGSGDTLAQRLIRQGVIHEDLLRIAADYIR